MYPFFIYFCIINCNLFIMSELNEGLEALVGQMGAKFVDSEPSNIERSAEQTTQTQEDTVTTPQSKSVEQTPTQSEATVEQPQSSLNNETESVVSLDDSSVLSYLSEKLGREVSGFEDLTSESNTSADIDERVLAINNFIKETGRDIQDWFAYQAMNPSEMDDLSAVKMQLKSQYGDVSESDIDLILENKYNLDEDLYDENEVRLAKLQLKVDADKARQEIETVRSQYATPVKKEEPQQQQTNNEEFESIVTDEWLNSMSAEVDALEGIEFELAKDKSFTFGIEDNYKSTLKSKNENIEDFFSNYVSEDGQWDFERWNMHQAVLDNIETIVKSAYQQGLGDGQRNLVSKAANVQSGQPQVGDTGNNVPSIEDQVRQALGLNDNGLTFKI